MMIRPINLADPDYAELIWGLQHAAYRMEAELIGFDRIPPLLDTVESLQSCDETFLGYFDENDDDDLAGAIAYTRDPSEVTICRLMVHPDRFRKGIGRQLLRHVQELESSADKFIVLTSAMNAPAIGLYEQEDFRIVKEMVPEPGVHLVVFEKYNKKSI